MRLVSQDGNVDIPYERANIVCHNEHIGATVGENEFRLAKYLTSQKALKVMEMLREEYFETVYDYRTKPKVFQFPKDEDVEV